MEELTELVYAKYEFTQEEMLKMSHEMAQSASKKKEAEDRMKSVQSSIKAEINSEDANINKFAEKIRAGYEMRPHNCRLQYDTDTVDYLDTETGEIVYTRPITHDEQLRLSKKK